MHDIEPFDNWINLYVSSEDELSPFYGREYSETMCSNVIYNYYIHPLWDEFGSTTLYIKILFVEYNSGFAIIELLGEWNDCLHNDIMFLKRSVIDVLIAQNINKFILIGENVLNFHYSDYDYYQEWNEDIEDGWLVCINFRDYVVSEFKDNKVNNYMIFLPTNVNWRKSTPLFLFEAIDKIIPKRLT